MRGHSYDCKAPRSDQTLGHHGATRQCMIPVTSGRFSKSNLTWHGWNYIANSHFRLFHASFCSHGDIRRNCGQRVDIQDHIHGAENQPCRQKPLMSFWLRGCATCFVKSRDSWLCLVPEHSTFSCTHLPTRALPCREVPRSCTEHSRHCRALH